MEAVDTIKQMNDCSDSVLNSLVVLNKSQSKYFQTSDNSSNKIYEQMRTDCESVNKYKTALILRLIVDMPLNVSVWALISLIYQMIHSLNPKSIFL